MNTTIKQILSLVELNSAQPFLHPFGFYIRLSTITLMSIISALVSFFNLVISFLFFFGLSISEWVENLFCFDRPTINLPYKAILLLINFLYWNELVVRFQICVREDSIGHVWSRQVVALGSRGPPNKQTRLVGDLTRYQRKKWTMLTIKPKHRSSSSSLVKDILLHNIVYFLQTKFKFEFLFWLYTIYCVIVYIIKVKSSL